MNFGLKTHVVSFLLAIVVSLFSVNALATVQLNWGYELQPAVTNADVIQRDLIQLVKSQLETTDNHIAIINNAEVTLNSADGLQGVLPYANYALGVHTAETVYTKGVAGIYQRYRPG